MNTIDRHDLPLELFDYELPAGLIAQHPAPERTGSRLLVPGDARDDYRELEFRDLPGELESGDLVVFNDTRVVPARLSGRKSATGGRVELLLERIESDHTALVQIGASKTPRAGARIELDGGATATVNSREGAFWRVRLDSPITIAEYFGTHGDTPLPPYIARAADRVDEERYQTVYARDPGAVAAPTAGLHFDHGLMRDLEKRGVELGFLTLHVGAGTFQPIRSETLAGHRMHKEHYCISETLARSVASVRSRGNRVIAVGTTVVRALESAARSTGQVEPGDTETALFIAPGFRFNVVDRLVTNFHLPKSSLLVLVSAFAGRERVLDAYRHAIERRFRFYSYGDAMLLSRKDP